MHHLLRRRSLNWLNPKAVFYLFFTVILTVSSAKTFAEVNAENGKKIYKQYCTSCHALDHKLVGPALTERVKLRSEDYLIKWIRNNSALRAAGDKDAIAIYTEYGKNEMPQFTSFTDDEIKSIIAYAANPPVPVNLGPPIDPKNPISEPTSIWLYVVLLVLIVVAFILIRTNNLLKRLSLEKSGEHVPVQIPWGKKLRSWQAYMLYGFILVFIFGWTISDSAMRLGHSKNYQPEQPIKFSHQLHAGINQINCLYCHASAEKSKVAGIPTVNTCMNCHKGVQAGQSDAGTAEIAKLLEHYNNNKPIEWTKIHNLPDHVYFNHSQHVTVGKVACQTCHGQIQEMDQVYQFSSLSMGWCINCHRETKVQFEDNGFYTMYSQMHAKLDSMKKINPDATMDVTEAMMGGTECQKCHY